MAEPLLIIGASGRAAAASARRAGWQPSVIDLFADADTRRICEVSQCKFIAYPQGFIALALQKPPMHWMYTGGLENHPDVVAAISQRHKLIGNPPQVQKLARDPHLLASLAGSTARFAPVATNHRELQAGTWLRKPRGGSAGHGIRFASITDAVADADAEFYYQQWQDGTPCSAVFDVTTDSPVAVGVTEQLIGTPWLHARPFQYSGNLTRPMQTKPLGRWPSELVRTCGLQASFGVDYVEQPRQCWIVEVNPRYTASVEVIEWARLTAQVVGKAIYFAARPIVFPASGPWDEDLRQSSDVWTRGDFADIPTAGSEIEAGQPVFTLLAEAETLLQCRQELMRRAGELDKLFRFPFREPHHDDLE